MSLPRLPSLRTRSLQLVLPTSVAFNAWQAKRLFEVHCLILVTAGGLYAQSHPIDYARTFASALLGLDEREPA